MKNVPPSVSLCRSCRNYSPMGRRGGECQRLDIPVQSGWKACSLAIPALSKWKDWDLVMDINPISVDPSWVLPPQSNAQTEPSASVLAEPYVKRLA